MTPLSQYKFYDLGAKLSLVIASKTAVSAADMFVPLQEAQTALDNLLKGDPIKLDFSKSDANILLNKLGSLFNKHFIDMATRQFRFPGREEVIDGHELTLVKSLIEKFELSLAAELSRKPIYAVPKRGLYDMRDLVEQADTQFGDDALGKMPETMRSDLRHAGRALAFELPEAACFHLIRAVDAAKAQSAKNSNNIQLSALLNDMDARIRPALGTSALRMTMDDATLFFGMAGALISLLMEEERQQPDAQAKPPMMRTTPVIEAGVQDILSDEEAMEIAASFADEASSTLSSASLSSGQFTATQNAANIQNTGQISSGARKSKLG
jgi:hypothetical protein